MTDQTLTDALAELRRVTEQGDPMEAGVPDHAVATILNAALSGDLIPRETALAMVAAVVEKAAKAVTGRTWNGVEWHDDLRNASIVRALTDADATAALDAMISRAREVKPLVWEGNFAATPWGGYSIKDRPGPQHEWDHFGWAHSSRGDFDESDDDYPTPEAAKAAAQADYTARIHAALVVSNA